MILANITPVRIYSSNHMCTTFSSLLRSCSSSCRLTGFRSKSDQFVVAITDAIVPNCTCIPVEIWLYCDRDSIGFSVAIRFEFDRNSIGIRLWSGRNSVTIWPKFARDRMMPTFPRIQRLSYSFNHHWYRRFRLTIDHRKHECSREPRSKYHDVHPCTTENAQYCDPLRTLRRPIVSDSSRIVVTIISSPRLSTVRKMLGIVGIWSGRNLAKLRSKFDRILIPVKSWSNFDLITVKIWSNFNNAKHHHCGKDFSVTIHSHISHDGRTKVLYMEKQWPHGAQLLSNYTV